MMRNKNYCFALLLFIFSSFTGRAQDIMNDPGAYLSYVVAKERDVTKTYLAYLSAVSHGKGARKVEKLRLKTVDAIWTARTEVAGTPPYRGDRSLKDASVAHIKLVHSVFNEDYSKIVNMEEIAEQSYDAMEAYLLAQKKAHEKLDESGKRRDEQGKAFAAKYNITIIEGKDELGAKAAQAEKVMDYYHKVYLIFFKSFKQDMYLTEAINATNLNALEQNRSTLVRFASEGLQQLEGMEGFQTDKSLVTACSDMLRFYKDMAEKDVQPVSDFMLAQEQFAKQKKKLEATPAVQRSQSDIDQYNGGVEKINKALSGFNKTNKDLNSRRNTLINAWNNAVNRFLDAYVPYAK